MAVVKKFLLWLSYPRCINPGKHGPVLLAKLTFILAKMMTLPFGRQFREQLYQKGFNWRWFFLGEHLILVYLEKLDLALDLYENIWLDSLGWNTYIDPSFWEPQARAYWKPRAGDIVLDVGAAVGIYTLPSARQVGPNGRVVAIEANPSVFRLLVRNLQVSELRNVIALNIASWNEDAVLELDTDTSSLVFGGEHTIKVQGSRLDTVVAELKLRKVDWLKIDVEGAELQSLEGARRILKTCSPILLIETHSEKLEKETMELLHSLDYVTHVVYKSHTGLLGGSLIKEYVVAKKK